MLRAEVGLKRTIVGQRSAKAVHKLNHPVVIVVVNEREPVNI